MMSYVCQGEFSSALKVIANQKETIDKIKEQFEFLANLATKNSNISIEPIFIKISTYNQEMGDWIIRRLLQMEGTPTNAALTGKLIISESKMIAPRLNLLIESILKKVAEAVQMPRGSVSQTSFILTFQQFISICVRSMRYAATNLSATDPEIDLSVSQESIL